MAVTKANPAISRAEPIFKLKVSEREKFKKDGQYFKDFLNYLVPYDTTVVDDYREMKLSYDLVNNDIEGFKDEVERFVNPLGEDDLLPTGYEEELLPYSRIYNKVNVLVGELLKRKDSHKIMLLSDKEVKEKSDAQKEAIRAAVEEKVAIMIEKTKAELQGKTEEEVAQLVQEMKTQLEPEDLADKSFMTEWEIFNSKALQYCHYSQEIMHKKQLTMRHGITADRFFWYVGWEYGEPVIKVLNPLHCGWHKSPEVTYVEKGDYFWNKRAITLADAYHKYIDVLKDDEWDRLSVYTPSSNLRVDKRHDVRGGGATKVFDTTTEDMFRHSEDQHDKTVGQAMGSGTNRRYNSERLLWETHIEFKGFREIIFLTYLDEYNKEITEIVDGKFEIPEHADKVEFINKFNNTSHKYTWTDEFGQTFSAEKLWIPRRYEATRLGQDVYVNMREVPNQPINVDNPYKDFELSYKGRVLTNLNSRSISLVQRAIPVQFQAFFVKLILNRELAKYQGFATDIDVDQIPDYLEQDENGEPIPGRDKVAIWKLYLKKMGYNFYSGSQSSDGLPPSTRSPGSRSAMTGTAAELINLQQLLEVLDAEIGMAMGISPQREAMFSSNSNVSDNQQAITQSHHITEPYFFMHAECWKRVLNEWLKLFRMYCSQIFENNPEKKEHFIHYVTPNGTKELLMITPDMLDHNDIGLYLANSGQDQFYRDSMMQMAHAFGQNAGEGMEAVSAMLKSIANGDSPEEIHKMLIVEGRNQQERMQRMEEMKAQQQKELQKMQIEAREDEQAHKVELEHIKGDYMLQRAAIEVYKMQQDLNQDQDGIPDPLEAAKIAHDMAMDVKAGIQKDRELDQKDAEIGRQSEKDRTDAKLKEKEIATKKAEKAQKAKQKPKT